MGTIYSQMLSSQSTDHVADYSRLSAEADEEVRTLSGPSGGPGGGQTGPFMIVYLICDMSCVVEAQSRSVDPASLARSAVTDRLRAIKGVTSIIDGLAFLGIPDGQPSGLEKYWSAWSLSSFIWGVLAVWDSFH